MYRFTTVLYAICVTLATTQAEILTDHSPVNALTVARRAVNAALDDDPVSRFLNSDEYKNTKLDFDTTGQDPACKDSTLRYDHVLHPYDHPDEPHPIDSLTITTCRVTPVLVNSYKFTITSTCDDRDIMKPRLKNLDITYYADGFEYREVNGVIHEVIHEADIETCIKPLSADCWGEWIVEPAWDFEWQFKIPREAMHEQNGQCGVRFEQAIKDACYPFEQNKFECSTQPLGAIIKVRHSLLCGRSKIMKGLRQASDGALADLSCPYFVEVPVPSN